MKIKEKMKKKLKKHEKLIITSSKNGGGALYLEFGGQIRRVLIIEETVGVLLQVMDFISMLEEKRGQVFAVFIIFFYDLNYLFA